MNFQKEIIKIKIKKNNNNNNLRKIVHIKQIEKNRIPIEF